jgi:CheY-like chemotaxis protein
VPSSFRCPRCGAVSDVAADAQGVITCPQCGVKLRSRVPTTAASPAAPAAAAPWAPNPALPAPVAADPPSPPAAAASLESVLREVRAVRALQEHILATLRAQGAAPPAGVGDDDDAPAPPPREGPPVRTRRRKTVLLIDDDPASRAAAKAALETAEVPVRVVDSGNGALAAIAAEKPDVIAIELEMGGAMAAKDVINVIKATMEWVDIPLILYTRAPVANQKEARTIHGADELVAKNTEGPKALVSRVITLFRRA